MGLTNPYRQHNYMGEHSSNANALTFIQANKWDSNGNGTGNPQDGMFYFNTADKRFVRWESTGAVWRAMSYGESHAGLGSLTGPADDHTQYLLVAGTRAMGGDLDMASAYHVKNMLDPTLDQQAATKKYVDDKIKGLDWQESVISKTLTTPPGGEAVGDRYLIASPAAGAWAGKAFQIAEVVSIGPTVWTYTIPDKNTATFVEATNVCWTYNAAWDTTDHWVAFASIVAHNSLSGLDGGTAGQYYHMTSAQHTAIVGVGNDASSYHIHDNDYYVKANVPKLSTGAGNPNGVVLPTKVGDIYIDTTNFVSYIAHTALNTGWVVF